MITLNLLHPIEAKPIQTWKFDSEPVIRIGRSGDNDIILYSSVVSRYHVEIHRHSLNWEIVNIGANGTYIDEHQIDKEPLQNGMTIRLAATGPKIQIFIDGDSSEPVKVSPTQPTNLPKADSSRPTFRPTN
ncbi:MAG: hypothetical protein DCE90_15595 [Pseudanabaena sp.]|nr:MAG: hypothetical protein DCE90_15595 [Pseudanabaena sp.]